MSILVIGLSHQVAPVALLERAALGSEQLTKLLIDSAGCPHVGEAVVVATCNRIEVYAEVERFHGGVDDLSDLLSRHTGVGLEELTPHLYVRYEDGAVAHLFSVVCGLDSMVVGETQILGQVKAALRLAQEVGAVGTALNVLFQQALRVGKRAHTDTDLGRVGRSLVSAALEEAVPAFEPVTGASAGELAGRRALVIGAGSMAALAAITLHRDYDVDVVIANRTPDRAARLAAEVDGRAVGLDAVRELLGPEGGVDLVVSCTRAGETVVAYDHLRARGASSLVVIDLAMPRDVDEAVATLPGVTLIDLDRLAGTLAGRRTDLDIGAVKAIVAEELTAFLAARRADSAAPTVVALRGMATEVAETELQRLASRLPELDAQAYAEVERTVRRVVDKLLHVPTVRVKELAERPVRTSYADALRELFALDQEAVAALEEPGQLSVQEEAGDEGN